MSDKKPDVMLAVLKLMRAMRRRPPRPERFPPGGGRLLEILADNDGITSRELAELLDIRPSSLTELLGRLEREELVGRTPDDSDKRVSRVSLTAKGHERESALTAERHAQLERLAACFSDEEAVQFCTLCERLSAHLEAIAEEDRAQMEKEGFPPPMHGPGFRHGHRPPPPPFDDYDDEGFRR